MMKTHPDWAPLLHQGHTELKTIDSSRHVRQTERASKKQKMVEPPSEEVEEAVVLTDVEGVGAEGDQLLRDGNERTDSQSVQTDVTLEEIDSMTDEDELNRLFEENINLTDKLASKEFETESFKGGGEKM